MAVLYMYVLAVLYMYVFIDICPVVPGAAAHQHHADALHHSTSQHRTAEHSRSDHSCFRGPDKRVETETSKDTGKDHTAGLPLGICKCEVPLLRC